MEWDGVSERRQDYQVLTKEEKDNLLNDIKNIRLILTGNGDPKRGLVYRVDRHDDFISNFTGGMRKLTWAVVTAVLGVPATVVGAWWLTRIH